MKKRLLYSHATKLGAVFIAQGEDGRFLVLWHGEALGSYGSAHQAAADAAGGHVFVPSSGLDLGALGLSDALADWVPLAPEK